MYNMNEIYGKRREAMTSWMAEKGVEAVIFRDSEECRSPSVRYFTGQPTDATFVLAANGRNILIPWDENMARKMAVVDEIIPFTRYERNPVQAVAGALKKLKVPHHTKVEIPGTTTYPEFLHYVDVLSEYDVICRENGSADYAVSLRAVKDEYEIDCTRKAAAITDALIDSLEAGVRNGTITTETDAALLIERECRKAGCEGTGFDTLAAGPARSFGIHCFPPYTAGEFPAQGLSILDFGVIWQGYTSDVTLTFAKGPLTPAQEKQLELVQQAYDEAVPLYVKDVPVRAAAVKADEVFAAGKRVMPHSLGHGIGLECHEAPLVRPKTPAEELLKPGMIVTCEPGLYDEKLGGCRLENDILVTEDGNEVLTHARIIRL